MKKFAMIIAPVIWHKLPLPGIACILENLRKNRINTYLYDINIELYNKFKKSKKPIKNWTKNYYNFTHKFYQYIHDKHGEIIQQVIKAIKQEHISNVGFTIYKSNLIFSLDLARLIKKEIPGIKIIFGGPHVAYLHYYNPDYLKLENIDHFIMGEGEYALLDILNKKTTKRIIHASQVRDINNLPFPKYTDFSLGSYERKNSLPIISSRGCINKCNFCFERIAFKKYTIRRPEYIIEEINYHIKNNKTHWFTFYDSIFNGSISNLEKFVSLIESKRLEFIWDAQISIRNQMSNQLLKAMKKNGCINLFIGLEAGNNFILKQMNKKFTVKEAESFFKKLIKNGLNFETSLILNYPLESDKEYRDTTDFLIRNKQIIPKIAQINPYIYYPGTDTDITQGYNFLKGMQKSSGMLKILDKNRIKYTNAYINNLIE